jgi:CRISPR-associated protein Csc1
MMQPKIRLVDHGIRLFHAVLETHDFLWFSSYDVSTVSSTEVVVHNYALTYALSRFERGVVTKQTPTYGEDLARMPFYATPANLLLRDNPFAGKVKQTWNALDTRTQQTQDPEFNKEKKLNTPMLGTRVVIAPMTRFSFYVFTLEGQSPPGAIRLGKKRVPCRVHYTEITKPVAHYRTRTFAPSHLINPLDVQGNVETFNPINIPPHLLLRQARLCDDYVVTRKQKRTYHNVHVPGRILQRVEA